LLCFVYNTSTVYFSGSSQTWSHCCEIFFIVVYVKTTLAGIEPRTTGFSCCQCLDHWPQLPPTSLVYNILLLLT